MFRPRRLMIIVIGKLHAQTLQLHAIRSKIKHTATYASSAAGEHRMLVKTCTVTRPAGKFVNNLFAAELAVVDKLKREFGIRRGGTLEITQINR